MKWFISKMFCLFNCFVFFLYLLGDFSVKAVRITATPKEVPLGNSVVIHCNGSSFKHTYRLEIRRTSFGIHSDSLVADIDVGYESVALVRDALLRARGVRAEGRLDISKPRTTFLQLTFAQTQCIDNSQYICKAIGSGGSNMHAEEAAKTFLSVTTKPDALMMKVSPTRETHLGTSIIFICRGHIGKPAREIVWEKQQYDDEEPEAMLLEVQSAEPRLDYNICHYEGESVMRYTITKKDQGAVFTCRTREGGDGEAHYNYRLHVADLPSVRELIASGSSRLAHYSVYCYFLLPILSILHTYAQRRL